MSDDGVKRDDFCGWLMELSIQHLSGHMAASGGITQGRVYRKRAALRLLDPRLD